MAGVVGPLCRCVCTARGTRHPRRCHRSGIYRKAQCAFSGSAIVLLGLCVERVLPLCTAGALGARSLRAHIRWTRPGDETGTALFTLGLPVRRSHLFLVWALAWTQAIALGVGAALLIPLVSRWVGEVYPFGQALSFGLLMSSAGLAVLALGLLLSEIFGGEVVGALVLILEVVGVLPPIFNTKSPSPRNVVAVAFTAALMNVLLIEDDKRIAGLVERGLRVDGHEVTVTHNGSQGAEMMLAGEYDAALLDILLPGMDGLAVLEKVRSRRCMTPILVLTAVEAVPKVLEAFDLGADDYLVKPFLLEILLARVSAIARRAQASEPKKVLQAGGVTLRLSAAVWSFAMANRYF